MDLNEYCSKYTAAAVVTQKLREGATLEACVVVAKEFNSKRPPKAPGEKYAWGEKTSDIRAHIKWMEKRSVKFQQNGDIFKIVE